MSEFVYPLDGKQDYTAFQAGVWNGTRTSGVWSDDDNLSVSVTGARELTLSAGIAWFNTEKYWGKVYCNTEDLTFELPVADAILDFWCRVVLRWDKTKNIGTAQLIVGDKASAESGELKPPDRNTTDELYDLVLADYLVEHGETTASASNLYDRRMDETLCGLMRDGVTRLPTAEIAAQAQSILKSVQAELAALEAGSGVELKKLLFADTVVSKSQWVADKTYSDYGYRAAVALDGVITTMIPEIMLDMVDATDGNIAPVASTYAGGVYLYANNQPESDITIPTIICWRQ